MGKKEFTLICVLHLWAAAGWCWTDGEPEKGAVKAAYKKKDKRAGQNCWAGPQ